MSQRKNQPVAYPIEDKQTEENLRSSKGESFKRARVMDGATTTDAYGGVEGLIFDCRLLRRKMIHVYEMNVNAIKYQVLGCIDPRKWHVAISEQTVAQNGEDLQIVANDAPYSYLKLQVKASVGGSQGKVTAYMSGGSP